MIPSVSFPRRTPSSSTEYIPNIFLIYSESEHWIRSAHKAHIKQIQSFFLKLPFILNFKIEMSCFMFILFGVV